MRKMYQFPAIEVAEFKMESQVMAGSGRPAGAPGVNSSRSAYGNGGSQTW